MPRLGRGAGPIALWWDRDYAQEVISLVGAGNLRVLLDLVSPSFFDVMPASALWSEGRSLLASRRNPDQSADQLRELGAAMQDRGLPVRAREASLELGVGPTQDRELGRRVVEIFFAQLAHMDRASLDLRSARFDAGGTDSVWTPGGLACRWQPEFLFGLRQMYSGFYREDSERFDAGVRCLSLDPARDLLLEYFGDGDQSAVTFDTGAFRRIFHAIFVRCRDRGVTLHANFVSLGVYLATMYEHLEGLGGALDVRGAFETVWTP